MKIRLYLSAREAYTVLYVYTIDIRVSFVRAGWGGNKL